ncbi:hypothetical protein CPB83DRAFT_656828 [Crepidotus variabilis]|uniref:DUF6533 domain-containing protein n=1 Tax=Crepidotus variabilis TaxID=179855 RepID=A0A9P6JJZ5_9AGAR|nr:hypothetical protein CPB83DRAFT_656828 [Crepidotus variabilis]
MSSREQSALEFNFVISSLTIIIYDILLHIPEDLRLFRKHPIRLPSLVYAGARASTLAVFIFAVAIIPLVNPFLFSIAHVYSPAQGSVTIWTLYALLMIQRGTTSLLLYLRVYALYQSNRYVQTFFLAALLGVTATPLILFGMSGIACSIFDLGILVAILWKVKWHRPTIYYSSPSSEPEANGRWTYWNPFKCGREHEVTDQFLKGTLAYVLLAILIKIPQIFALTGAIGIWPIYTTYPELVVSCIVSCNIFRNLKLGLSRHNGSTSTSILTTPRSRLEFRIPESRNDESDSLPI